MQRILLKIEQQLLFLEVNDLMRGCEASQRMQMSFSCESELFEELNVVIGFNKKYFYIWRVQVGNIELVGNG